MIILGAGMSGCIAAVLNGSATVLEASTTPPTNHNAVLRFRTDNISKITGIKFKPVHVNKAIFYDGQLHSRATPRTANLYSRKVTGTISSRSIWSLEPVDRFVAPKNFHQQLLDQIGDRVKYGVRIDGIEPGWLSALDFDISIDRPNNCPIISTMPMPVLAKIIGIPLKQELFSHAPITTARITVPGCDAHQTVYFADPDTPLYRATLTGDDLILEFACGALVNGCVQAADWERVIYAFGLIGADIAMPVQYGMQKYGKIAPVDSTITKAFMFEATRSLGVYSLGRFAVWRNILLDDVYSDVFQIRRMIEQSHYELRKESL